MNVETTAVYPIDMDKKNKLRLCSKLELNMEKIDKEENFCGFMQCVC